MGKKISTKENLYTFFGGHLIWKLLVFTSFNVDCMRLSISYGWVLQKTLLRKKRVKTFRFQRIEIQ